MARWVRDVSIDGYQVTQAARRRAKLAEADDARAYRNWLSMSERRQRPPGPAGSIRGPMISIVMPVYAPPPDVFDAAISSVRAQTYADWELCLAEDASPEERVRNRLRHWMSVDDRIRCVFRPLNGGIAAASNSALEIVRGNFFVLMDQDDMLTGNALECVAAELVRAPDVDIIYTDEDKLDASGQRCSPYFKPDWDAELVLAQNYLAHLIGYRTELVRRVGGFREGFDGSQDHDLLLRCVEQIDAAHIGHIPQVLYHWRIGAGSTALHSSAKPHARSTGVRAVSEHLQRRSIRAHVEPDPNGPYRVHYEPPAPPTAVSMVAAWRSPKQVHDLATVLRKSGWPAERLEIILVAPGHSALDLPVRNTRFVPATGDILPAMFQQGAEQATGDILSFVTDAVIDADEGWLARLVAAAAQPHAGIVGAKCVSPRGVILEGGYVGDLDNPWCDPCQFLSDSTGHFFQYNRAPRHCAAVSWNGLTLKRRLLPEYDPLWRTDSPPPFSAIDLCWRARMHGKPVIWTPEARLVLNPKRWRRDAEAQLQSLIPAVRRLWPNPPDSRRFLNPVFDIHHNDFRLDFAMGTQADNR